MVFRASAEIGVTSVNPAKNLEPSGFRSSAVRSRGQVANVERHGPRRVGSGVRVRCSHDLRRTDRALRDLQLRSSQRA
jgi:hypothetical protein